MAPRALLLLVCLAVGAYSAPTKMKQPPAMHPSMPRSAVGKFMGYKVENPVHMTDLARKMFSQNTPPRDTIVREPEDPELVDHGTGDMSKQVGLIGKIVSQSDQGQFLDDTNQVAENDVEVEYGDGVNNLGPTWVTDPHESEKRAQTGPISTKRDFVPADQQGIASDVTLSTQSDIDRLGSGTALVDMAAMWQGPISYAVLVTGDREAEAKSTINALRQSNSAVRKHVSFHLCVATSKWSKYPINLMRNVAKANVGSDWVFIVDADELVSGSMKDHVRLILKARHLTGSDSKVGFVVRSFEWKDGRDLEGPPRSFGALKKAVQAGMVGAKHNYFKKAYNPDDFDGRPEHPWMSADRAKVLAPIEYFEPYFIAKTASVPDFDTRFVGWGGNKNTITWKMQLDKWTFVMLNQVFTFADESKEETEAVSTKKQQGNTNNELTGTIMMRVAWEAGCSGCNQPEDTFNCFSSCPVFNKNSHVANLMAVQKHVVTNVAEILLEKIPPAASRIAPKATTVVALQQPGAPPSSAGPGGVEEVAGDGGISTPEDGGAVLEKETAAASKAALALAAVQQSPEATETQPQDETAAAQTQQQAVAQDVEAAKEAMQQNADEAAATPSEEDGEECEEQQEQTPAAAAAAAAENAVEEAKVEEKAEASSNGGQQADGEQLEAATPEQEAQGSAAEGEQAAASQQEGAAKGRMALAADMLQKRQAAVEPQDHNELVVIPGGQHFAVPMQHVHGHDNAADYSSTDLDNFLAQRDAGVHFDHSVAPNLGMDHHPETYMGAGVPEREIHFKPKHSPHLSPEKARTLNPKAVAYLKGVSGQRQRSRGV